MWFDGLGNSLSRFAPPSLPLPYQQVVAPFTMSLSSELGSDELYSYTTILAG